MLCFQNQYVSDTYNMSQFRLGNFKGSIAAGGLWFPSWAADVYSPFSSQLYVHGDGTPNYPLCKWTLG